MTVAARAKLQFLGAAADRLREVGEALYGPQWQCSLARALQDLRPEEDRVDSKSAERRLRYWLQGVKPPETLEADLRRIVSERIAALAKLLE